MGLRQDQRRDAGGDSIAGKRGRRADDLHDRRQAVHRISGRRRAIGRGADRSFALIGQIAPSSLSTTPATQDPASTVSMPTLKRKIAVAAATARTSAAISRLDHTGLSNDSPNERTGA